MSEFRFRLAEPIDAEAFSHWAAENPQIEVSDIEAGLKKNNPTAVTFVVEKDGIAILFAPLICVMQLCHLGFNPESRGSEKLQAMQVLLDGVSAFAVQFGVRQITTLTRADYGVARWAATHGFEKDSRELFRYDINQVLEVATKE